DFHSLACNNGTATGDVNGLGPDSLCGPQGLSVDSDDNLFVSDALNNRVLGYMAPFDSPYTTGQPALYVLGQTDINGNEDFFTMQCNPVSKYSLCGPQDVSSYGPDLAIVVADT